MPERLVIIPEKLDPKEVRFLPVSDVYQHARGSTMGTGWSARYYAPAHVKKFQVERAFEASFRSVIKDFSNWDPGSTISKFNQAPAGTKINVSDSVNKVLSRAQEIAKLTSGAFNPGLGLLASALTFGAAEMAEESEIEECHSSDWQPLRIGLDQSIIQPGGVALDLSAIAKGFAVDQMADVLAGFGVRSFLVEIGGEFVGQGVRPDGLPWWVTVETVLPDHEYLVALCGLALATSGEGQRYRLDGGKGLPHIVKKASTDEGLISVSVLQATCMEADAWATALFALGTSAGLKIANELGLKALFQFRNSSSVLSDALVPLTR